ncbi:PKD domain-containing protein [Rhodanobacter sp. C05]|uniref:PKD domain-containing protein n=1 Tax=Rhodanobacter sp. C05 TaxID=1945855 RepID=UPI00098732A8|nr:PKD domain-containing protein [Rhodanobacter sp. C05]OOG38233.1 xanthomonalisin [Rhodanobacter sp. C05]
MSSSFQFSGYRKALLPAALSLAMFSLSAHAADTWVSTNTHASIQKSAVANVSTLVMTGHPAIDASQIMPLEASKQLHVVLSLNLRNAAQLQTFLRELNQPGSANYHKYLTPAQFKAQYAPTDAQVQAVVAHLQKYGFSNISVTPNNMLVSANGTPMSASGAFNTSLKTFSYNGKQHFANDTDVAVPQALGGIVGSVLGLQDINKPHVMSHRVTPDMAGTMATGSQVGHQPTDFPTIYDVGSTANASNTTVGIITWGDMTQTIKDLNTFTKNAGLATVNTLTVPGGSGTLASDGDDGEWALDSQDITAVSGGVKQLIFYAAINGDSNDSGLTDATITAAYNTAVTANVAKVINVSLGEDETAANNSGTQAADDKVFVQAVAQGQTFSIAAGDAGVYQWSSDPTEGAPGYVANSSGTVKITLSHYGVSEPATSPNVIAVGGTTLSTTGTTTWAGETVWNEGLAAVDPNNGDNNKRLWATGGGVSLFEAAPAWQTTALGSSVTKRQVPDLAFDAASSTGAIIVANGQTGQQYGGTSLASPIFVGIWARIESANSNSLGLPAQNIYTYFPKDATALHDVTSGNNGYNGYGYNAAAGFDNTTGWGSLDISKFSAYVTKYWGGSSSGSTPVASFTDTVSNLTASFTNTSTDTGGTISSYAWNFGDGSTSTAASPSHTYTAAGTYTVSLQVTDNTGATSTKTGSVTVTAAAAGNPVAGFTDTVSGLTATFTNTSTDTGGTINSYAWNFGDSSTSTAASPSHSYAAAGTYSVSLKVTDNTGASSTKTGSVTVTSSAPTQLLGNTGFETGAASPWTVSSGTLCSTSSSSSSYCGSGETSHAGTWFAWLDGYGASHTDTVSQQVVIPSGKTTATLQYYLHIDTTKTTAVDTLKVQVLNTSGTVLATVGSFTNLNKNTGYAVETANLAAYIGQTVVIKFTGAETSSSGNTDFTLDDVTLTVQ